MTKGPHHQPASTAALKASSAAMNSIALNTLVIVFQLGCSYNGFNSQTYHGFPLLIKKDPVPRDFPGGSVVKNPPSIKGHGSGKIPHAVGQLNPPITTTETCAPWGPREAAAIRSPLTAARAAPARLN